MQVFALIWVVKWNPRQYLLSDLVPTAWSAKLLILVPALLVFLWLLPKEPKFNLQYQMGFSWQHTNLHAPFDFPVLKEKEQLIKEQEEVLATVLPIFSKNESDFPLIWKEFKQKVQSDIADSINFDDLKNLFLAQTEKGILSQVDKQGLSKKELYLLNEQKQTVIKPVAGFLSLQEAYLQFEQAVSFYDDTMQAKLKEAWRASFRPNVRLDSVKTATLKKDALRSVATTLEIYKTGQLIIAKGAIVTPKVHLVLKNLQLAYKSNYNQAKGYKLIIGQLILLLLLFGTFIYYIFVFKFELFSNHKNLALLVTNQIIFLAFASIAYKYEASAIYIIPFVLLPIIVRSLFDTWSALFTHTTTILLASFYAPDPDMFLVLQLSAGYIAIFSLVNIRRRSQFILAAGVLLGVYCLGFIGYKLMQPQYWQNTDYWIFVWFFASSLLTLLASPLLIAYEKLFGFVSDVTLMELADSNNALLRQLSFAAPGTFQHSLQVANLAEAAIYQIGGNALLVRVGALYHDIGKLKSPQFFIENQMRGFNPHDDLPPDESAKIIIDHVYYGIELAKKSNLPEVVIDFIRTHHGDQRVEYFYRSFKRQNEEGDIDLRKFTYPGPKPFNKETAVLMLADSVEAASRALKELSTESIDALVENIISDKLKHNQLDRANITMEDIFRIKAIFKNMLKSIYHLRIEYLK